MYTHGQRFLGIGVPGTPIPAQTPAIKGASTCFMFGRPVEVSIICATVTVQMTVTAAVIDFIYRPIPGATTNQVVLGRITIPTAATIGQQIYKKVNPVECNPGGEIVIELITAATAGAAAFGVLVGETAETPGNMTAMVASA